MGEPSDQETLSDVLRRKSAGWLLLAEEDPELTEALDMGDRLGFDSSPIRSLRAKMRQQALLMHSVTAAQARAYDDMIAAGGPDNPEAYENYRQATDFHNALLSSDDSTEDDPGQAGE